MTYDGAPIEAIIDTGSELNICTKKVFMNYFPGRTLTKNHRYMMDANGGKSLLAGVMKDVELDVGELSTVANIHVGAEQPFGLLLGRPWQRGNFISIDEKQEGTYLIFKDPETQQPSHEMLVVPEQRVFALQDGDKTAGYLNIDSESGEIYYDTAEEEEDVFEEYTPRCNTIFVPEDTNVFAIAFREHLKKLEKSNKESEQGSATPETMTTDLVSIPTKIATATSCDDDIASAIAMIADSSRVSNPENEEAFINAFEQHMNANIKDATVDMTTKESSDSQNSNSVKYHIKALLDGLLDNQFKESEHLRAMDHHSNPLCSLSDITSSGSSQENGSQYMTLKDLINEQPPLADHLLDILSQEELSNDTQDQFLPAKFPFGSYGKNLRSSLPDRDLQYIPSRIKGQEHAPIYGPFQDVYLDHASNTYLENYPNGFGDLQEALELEDMMSSDSESDYDPEVRRHDHWVRRMRILCQGAESRLKSRRMKEYIRKILRNAEKHTSDRIRKNLEYMARWYLTHAYEETNPPFEDEDPSCEITAEPEDADNPFKKEWDRLAKESAAVYENFHQSNTISAQEPNLNIQYALIPEDYTKNTWYESMRLIVGGTSDSDSPELTQSSSNSDEMNYLPLYRGSSESDTSLFPFNSDITTSPKEDDLSGGERALQRAKFYEAVEQARMSNSSLELN